jgi:hypothetical protein
MAQLRDFGCCSIKHDLKPVVGLNLSTFGIVTMTHDVFHASQKLFRREIRPLLWAKRKVLGCLGSAVSVERCPSSRLTHFVLGDALCAFHCGAHTMEHRRHGNA